MYPEGPLNPDKDPVNMSEMFRPFQTLLYKIRLVPVQEHVLTVFNLAWWETSGYISLLITKRN